MRFWISRQRPIRLTSVKAAKMLALQKCGSNEALAKTLATDPEHLTQTNYGSYYTKWIQDAPLQQLREDNNHAAPKGKDLFGGMGCAPFSSMVGHTIENGLWCRGCELTYSLFRSRQLDSRLMSLLTAPECDSDCIVREMEYRAMSRAEFLEHAKHCHSAEEVVTKR